MSQLAYFILAFASGLGIAFQSAINSRLAVAVGGQTLVAAFISFAVGTLFLGILSLYFANWGTAWQALPQMSAWKWLGGVLGGIFVFIATLLAPKIGLVNMTFLMIIGQLITGLCIDGLGLAEMPVRPIMWWKYAGLSIMLAGLAVFMFGEKWFAK